MPSSHINDLPEELLELILRNAKEIGDPTKFGNSLLTCRKWHRIGLGLYPALGFATAVVLESKFRCNLVPDDVSNLIQYLELRFNLELPSRLYLSSLKSLTIHVQHKRNTSLHTLPRNSNLIGSLRDVFSVTGRLTTFSLHFSDGWDFPNLDVPAVPQRWLARIVGMLPDSVIDLEVDSAGTDISLCPEVQTDEEDHLCCQISKILTRLRHLRLRIGHVCNTILGHGFADLNDDTAASCDQNIQGDYKGAVKTLILQWHMRSLTIWLPWGSTLDSETPFSRACTALLDPHIRNSTVILIIQQTDLYCRERRTITMPGLPLCNKFTWTPHTNVSPSIRHALPDFRFATICGYSEVGRRRPSTKRTMASRTGPGRHYCQECAIIRDAPKRLFFQSSTFSPPPEPDTTTSHTYIALQTIENMLSWSTNMHSSYRYPLSQADKPNKPFWKGPDLWACQFPNCGVRSKSLVHLRGHQMYKHEEHTSSGRVRCPSTGCDWVGSIKDGGVYEVHLLGHHLGPCPKWYLHDS
ncbi:hypothetical protein T440DRAFT_467606 [Plenodomus tracheiphilus IPT5]|uniref:Uncharacterized protein n=1 Tax=Plenodomus tracheiphilus IPT5 TaxID=1408161 RepID=A0A6A7B8Y8_9PLEO|nr:hypothetical protein T440DRAFT_467606 [Plenodomus tracheiphilus IPT5]